MMWYLDVRQYQPSFLGRTSGTTPVSQAQVASQLHMLAQQAVGGTPPVHSPTSLKVRIPDLSAGKAWMSDDFNAPLPGEMGFDEE